LRDNGGRTRTRTLDPLIKSQLLYQLSYAPEAALRSQERGRSRKSCHRPAASPDDALRSTGNAGAVL
jgi:hypothetical protein